MKRLLKLNSLNYNVHDITNKLYKTIPLVPIGNLMQDIARDIQYGLYDGCGDPNTNWECWKNRCIEILKDRQVIDVMDRKFISTDPVLQNNKSIRLSETIYSWDMVCDIINNAGGRIYSSPYGDYSQNNFILKNIQINDIPRSNYLSIEQCKKYDLDEDENIIINFINEYEDGADFPPIVVDENYNVIDGSHRLGMYDYLGINTIKAFVLKK